MILVFNKNITNIFLFTSVIAVIMVLFRVLYTDNVINAFLVWNLFLAWIPYLISLLFKYIKNLQIDKTKKHFIYVITSALWLIFLPNASYIVTDYLHISQYSFTKMVNYHYVFYYDFLMWYDFIMISLYSFLGLALNFVTVYIVHKLLEHKINQFAWLIVLIVSLLSGFGIYLGRFIRFNSWDLLLNPIDIMLEISMGINIDAFIFSLLFGGFLFLTYLILYFISKINLNYN